MLITGKAVFKCPKTKEEVRLDIECLNADGKGNRCVFFKHWMWTGSHPLICCDYKQSQEIDDKKHQEEHIDEEPDKGETEWRDPQFIDDNS